MTETLPGGPERPIEMADEIIAHRKEIARVIVLVFLVAAALNFFTGILASLAWEKHRNALWIWILPLMLLIICGYYALWSYASKISQHVHFELLFPFDRRPEMASVDGRYYKPLHALQQRTREFFAKKTSETLAVAKDWNDFVENDLRSIEIDKSPKLLAFLIDLAEFFIYDTLANFGSVSLTAGARYIRFGWVRPNYDSIVLKQDGELAAIKENQLFQHLPNLVPRGLRFLKGFRFHRRPMQGQKKNDAAYFEFVSKYGSVRFTISPFPILMPSDSRDSQVIARYCGVSLDGIAVIKIPIMMTVDFRGLRPLRKKFSEKSAPWVEDLVEDIQHKIDWQYCARHDSERMIVELLGKES